MIPNDELVRREREEGEPVREGEGMGERRYKMGIREEDEIRKQWRMRRRGAAKRKKRM